jgi:predicted transcriptional regulator
MNLHRTGYNIAMEVHFTAEEQARLSSLAERSGKPVTAVVHDTVRQVLDDETLFVEAVQKGIASAERGRLLDHEEVVARIERRFGR